MLGGTGTYDGNLVSINQELKERYYARLKDDQEFMRYLDELILSFPDAMRSAKTSLLG
jgi:DNA-binding transcriptional ArsR family regulator